MASIRSLPQRESHKMASPSSVPIPDHKKKSRGIPDRWSRAILMSLQAGFMVVAVTVLYVGASKQQSKMSSHATMRIQRKNLSTSGLRASSDDKPTSQCTLWLAHSALKGHPGMGVFTTRHIPNGELAIPVNDGLTIPLYNFNNFYGRAKGQPNEKEKRAWNALWVDYVWSGNKPDHVSYEEPIAGMSSFAPCYSSLTNHHCTLASMRQHYPHPFYDDTLANRFKDAGAGAFTYDIGRDNTVTRDVNPGEELFLNYGYCKHDNHVADWAKDSFMPADYQKAKDITLELMWKSLSVKKGGGLVFDSQKALPLPKKANKLVTELLPKTSTDLQEMRASVDSVDNLEEYITKHNGLNNYEDPDWVRANGMCLENFRPGKSTAIPQAGRGAIAQFSMKKDEIVAPAPLLQIMDKKALKTYAKDKQDKWKETGKQLLLNYCFGHPQSSLLLCPQTGVVLINHCSVRTKECGSKGPNARIKWAGDWHASTKKWRKMSLKDMAKQTTGGLAFDVVATRDIRPGEEVFIDYGVEWEEAWKRHVKNWKPPKQSEKGSWITAKEANDRDGDILKEFVTGDLRKTTNHSYLFTGCQYWPSDEDEDDVYQQDEEWESWDDDTILQTYSYNGNSTYYNDYSRHYDHSFWPCSIIERTDKTYTVRIHQSQFEDEQPWSQNDVPRILIEYPREAIHYFVKPRMSDQRLKGAFRHSIGIPDSMFPEHWKNLKKTSKNNTLSRGTKRETISH